MSKGLALVPCPWQALGVARKQPNKPRRDGFDGARMKKLRLALNLSQLQLAYLTGLQPAHVSRYEANKKAANAETIVRLVRALKTNAGYLLRLTDDPSPQSQPK
jgi:transcriptional regulator with XRE-family HTH domain